MVKDPTLRLGTEEDMEEIFAHPAFKKIFIKKNKPDTSFFKKVKKVFKNKSSTTGYLTTFELNKKFNKRIATIMDILKPKAYNVNQDFLTLKHRTNVYKEINDKTDYEQELAKDQETEFTLKKTLKADKLDVV